MHSLLHFSFFVLCCAAVSSLGAGAAGNKPMPPPRNIFTIAQFGALPDTGQDSTAAFRQAIFRAGEAAHGAVIRLAPGRYDFYPEEAAHVPYQISNTLSPGNNETKAVGLLFQGARNLTIDGQGATLMFHGKMTPVVLNDCDGVTIQHLRVDFARPAVSEIHVTVVSGLSLEAQVHPDSHYKLEGGKLLWLGEGWQSPGGLSQEYDPARDVTWRSWDPVLSAKRIEEVKPGLLRFTYDHRPDTQAGHFFQFRDGVRDQVGVFIQGSKDITLKHLGLYSMPGLGLISQFSENLTFTDLACAPRPGSGRTCACFADFMHFSDCRGSILIQNCRFSGAQDDAINVHGVHLRIMSQPAPDQIVVQFSHPETWGFAPGRAGDEIDFIRKATLTSFGSGKIKSLEPQTPFDYLLTLEQPAPAGIALADDCIEDATWTPEVTIRGCRIARLPTRGILITTRRKVVIEDNVFYRTPMSAVLIADDAANWFESGMVRDVLIRRNTFIECAAPVISVEPQNTEVSAQNPVHRNIRIEDNVFQMPVGVALSAKSTAGLSFERNQFIGPGWDSAQLIDAALHLTACSSVNFDGNTLETNSSP